MHMTFAVSLMIVGSALLACQGKKAGEPGGGSAAATAGSGAAAVVDAAAAPGCDLTGEYRVRFFSNGTEGWWLRFNVAGSPLTAEATSPQAMLTLAPGPLAVVGDAATCALTLDIKSENAGDVKVAMTVDPATGAVKGQLTRTKRLEHEKPSVPVTGYRGPNTPPKGSECIAPGMYALDFDRAHPWKNDDADDDGSCKGDVISDYPLGQYLRVEWLGDQLAIDQVKRTLDDKRADKWDDDFGDETVRSSGCDVTLKIAGDGINLDGKVTFASGGAKGVAAEASLKIFWERDESQDTWACESKDLPISFALVKQP